tara:strand:+ start:2152 stop:2385 length:234 start_codon:yes stop_codon:yes gene_type:complete
MNNTDMKLGDETIAQIAKLVQLAILTGTDVVDNLRMMRVVLDEDRDELVLSDEYRETAEGQVAKLMEEVQTLDTQCS